jgi:MFS family permease
VPGRERTLTTVFPPGSSGALEAAEPRDDLLREEQADDGTFVQAHGPFTDYVRTVAETPDGVHQTIRYRLGIPWFTWLFALPVRRALRHRRRPDDPSPWWAPPDQLSERQARTLGLLAMAAMSATFANSLFTQTANFAADSFHISDHGQGIGGAVVRLGVLIALPFAVLADRLGRRRTIVLTAWLAPLLCALGALAPGFWVLVATQTVGRPLGIALGLLAGVAATEDMPKNSRAYSVSVLAMASGLGAGIAVAALRLADLGKDGWRLVYLLSLIWVPIAISLMRRLTETRRFETVHAISQKMNTRRLMLVAGVVLTSNLFIAPASFFQNRYLDNVRGYSGGGIAIFTLTTGTPASLGLIVGGRLADRIGRRALILICTPISTVCIVAGFMSHGTLMWLSALGGGLTAALAYPAFQVYRTELFPTGNRGRANGVVTTTALLSGSVGILAVGYALDHGMSFGTAMGIMGIGQLVAAALAFRYYPETAHLELEQLNPEDPSVAGLE